MGNRPDGASGAGLQKMLMAAWRGMPPVAIDRGADKECDGGDER